VGIGEAHRRYSRRINFRDVWRGHLWQGRFAWFPLDERHLMMAVTNVRAGRWVTPGSSRGSNGDWAVSSAANGPAVHPSRERNRYGVPKF